MIEAFFANYSHQHQHLKAFFKNRWEIFLHYSAPIGRPPYLGTLKSFPVKADKPTDELNHHKNKSF
jgi:hypothetical protein